MTHPLCGQTQPHDGHTLALPDGVGWCNGAPGPAMVDVTSADVLTTGSAGHAVGVAAIPAPWQPYEPPAVGRCGQRAPTALDAELDGMLPPIVCALPAGHAGWHRDERGAEWGTAEPVADLREVPDVVLTREQEIRARALHEAAGVFVGTLEDTLNAGPVADAVLTMAPRFEAYIRDGGR